jgi:methylated-DNA-[protein]-cysteine S-methyltransferase
VVCSSLTILPNQLRLVLFSLIYCTSTEEKTFYRIIELRLGRKSAKIVGRTKRLVSFAPGRFRLPKHRFQEALCMLCSFIDTPLGVMLAATDGDALRGLWFAGQKYFPEGASTWTSAPQTPVFVLTREYLKDYFAGRRPAMTIPLRPQGTAFQLKVWDALQRVPYGETTTYNALAEAAHCKAALAVGGAVGRNPISILIPCHRVLGWNGSLTGYAGGLDRKEALLRLEGAL